jgi:acyl-CoA:acyl-CoA alkyltransferase
MAKTSKLELPAMAARVGDRYAEPPLGWHPSDIDTLIFASTDKDTLEPATANILQEKLGITRINAFYLSNACNSILQGINVANSLIATGAARRVLIASGEMGSWVCNHRIDFIDDLKVKMGGLTLGDAGAALLLEPATGPDGIVEIHLLSMGEYWHLCHVSANDDWRAQGGTMHPWFYLNMPALARLVREVGSAYLGHYSRRRAGRSGERKITDSIDWFVPHQISRRLIEEGCRELGMNMDKVCITADRHGNTGGTAIPLALDHLMGTGNLRPVSGEEVFIFGAASGFGMGHVRLVF